MVFHRVEVVYCHEYIGNLYFDSFVIDVCDPESMYNHAPIMVLKCYQFVQ